MYFFQLHKLFDLIQKTYMGLCFQKQHLILDLCGYRSPDFNYQITAITNAEPQFSYLLYAHKHCLCLINT